MSSLDNFDIIDSISDEKIAEIDTTVYGHVGDVVLYNQKRDRFDIVSGYEYTLSEDECNCILMGIVLRQNEDDTVDVLMGNFLMASKYRMDEYIYFNTKPNHKRKYMYDLFKRYISSFRKKCPDYPKLKDMTISSVSVEDIDVISKNIDDIFKRYENIVGEKFFNKFLKRLFNNNIMCVHKNMIYIAKFDLDNDSVYSVEIPEHMYFDFLCVFRNLQISGYDNYDEDLRELLDKIKVKQI